MTQTQYVRHSWKEAERESRKAMGDAAYEAARAEVAADIAREDAERIEQAAGCCKHCDGAGMDNSGDDCAHCHGTGGW